MSLPRGAGLIKHVAEYELASLGHCYVFGGSPGPDGTGCWDCSSMQNYAWGRIGGQSIPDFPDGSYSGLEHGPSTIGWLDSQGTVTGSVPRDQAQLGDLAVWQTHMGFVLDVNEMISAANPGAGTIRSQIDGFIPGEQLIILRLAAIGAGGITLPIPTIPGTGHLDLITRDIAKSSRNLVWQRMQARTLPGKRF